MPPNNQAQAQPTARILNIASDWQTLLQTLPAQARLAVASGLTLPQAHIASRSVQAWQRQDWMPDKNTPTVFAFGV